MVYSLQKQYDLALADFAAVLQPPDDRRLFEAAYYRGSVELELGRLPAAEHEFDRVVAANPNFRLVYPARAWVRYIQGDERRGRDDYNHYLTLTRGPAMDLEGSEACRLRGHFLRELLVKVPGPKRKTIGTWAMAELQNAIKLGNRSYGLHQDVGAIHDKLGHPQLAITAYTRALALDPGEVDTQVMRGWAYVGQARFELAEADFTEAIRRDPEHAEAHAGLGFVRASLKAPGNAQREAFQAVLLVDKSTHIHDYVVLHNVACICAVLAQSDPGHATQYQDQAIDLLHRALDKWGHRSDRPSEIQYIKNELAFDASLRARPEFQALLRRSSNRAPSGVGSTSWSSELVPHRDPVEPVLDGLFENPR